MRLWVEIGGNNEKQINNAVSLLVRLWVEICRPLGRNWGWQGQPPCEAVSWNIVNITPLIPGKVSLLVRLWVEMSDNTHPNSNYQGQPPCEAVSWNTLHAFVKNWRQQSASLWGCELKSQTLELSTVRSGCQPPCEAVSWNTSKHSPVSLKQGQPPCEAVSWNGLMSFDDFVSIVSLLVRLWVEIFLLLNV